LRISRIRKIPAKIIVPLIIISLILTSANMRQGLKNFASGILTLPFKALSGAKRYFISQKNFSRENLVLKKRVASLSVELARMDEAKAENERLRALLGFTKPLRSKTIAAEVIARDSTDWRGGLIINKGSLSGIREHMPSATAEGVIGSVAEVAARSSKVMLITDPNSRIGVILEPSRESGILIGSAEGGVRVIYLSLDSDIKPGEKVLTAGFSAFFPKGLAIGEVTEVGMEPTNLYKHAVVKPFADLSRVEELVCIDAGKR